MKIGSSLRYYGLKDFYGTEEDLGNAYRGFGATSAIKEAEENR